MSKKNKEPEGAVEIKVRRVVRTELPEWVYPILIGGAYAGLIWACEAYIKAIQSLCQF